MAANLKVLMRRAIINFKKVFLVLAGCLGWGCGASEVERGSEEGRLIFHSGFEPESTVVPRNGDDDLTGADQSVAPPNDWVEHLEGYPGFGEFYIQYQGGEVNDRYARIIPDPTASGNHVLHYWLKNPRTPHGQDQFKGRIQANVYDNTDLTEVYHKRRLYLHPDLELLREYPDGFTWFRLEELWLAAGWVDHPYPFRIALSLRKDEGDGKPLYFGVHAQKRDEEAGRWQPTVWSESNRDFEVPAGQWMTLETYYRQGDDESGRFFFAVRPEGGERQVVFDVTDWTYSPEATEPVPMTHWNPLKLYTSETLVNYVRESGGVVQVYYDDWEVRDGPPGDLPR